MDLNQSGYTSGFGDTTYEKLCKIAASTIIAQQELEGISVFALLPITTGTVKIHARYQQPINALHLCQQHHQSRNIISLSAMADMPYTDLYSKFARTFFWMKLIIAGLSCSFGFCPPEICSYTLVGTNVPSLPPTTGRFGTPRGKGDYDLSEWTCKYGTRPVELCKCTGCPVSPIGFPDTGTMPK